MNPVEIEYTKTNREKAKTAKLGKFWCIGCDRAIVGEIGKCPVCGRKNNKRNQRQNT